MTTRLRCRRRWRPILRNSSRGCRVMTASSTITWASRTSRCRTARHLCRHRHVVQPGRCDVDGGANDYGGLVAGNVAAGPERNTAIEVGTKWEFFNQKLLATAALFQTTKDNAREQIGTVVVGSGAYRIRGIELGLNGKITDDWSIYGGLVLMDSKVTKTAIAANVGRQLANVAHQSFNLMTKYKINQYFEVGGQATYISKQYGGTLAATTGNVLPSSWKFDVFADVHINKMFALKFAVYNISRLACVRRFLPQQCAVHLYRPGASGDGDRNDEVLISIGASIQQERRAPPGVFLYGARNACSI